MTNNENEELRILKMIEKKLEDIECRIKGTEEKKTSWYDAYQGKVKK